ncbi:hypothetical protein HN014_15700 [Aquimarina sp. TRL1]|uniref:hypothetical protein n=1 Tax=Aquimarina sp. (strain TRL1) TaxID=2736252 RepID=UPI00158B7C30|nr:hypothetical protein [Aquimarina sp. TRL1]QKX06293.1 hypothetical protein HN014_15700 [Aquimarina sp. TRL1]
MKTFKTLFVALFISTFFIACEAETINEEVSVELEDEKMMTGEDENDAVGEERASDKN